MKKTTAPPIQKLSILLLFLVGAMIVSFLLFLFLNPEYSLPHNTRVKIEGMLERQRQVEQAIQTEYNSGSYRLDSPLVIQNPYGISPLTALVIFDTPQETQITVHVPGSSTETSVDFTFPGFDRHHEIPIYGLTAGKATVITLSAVTLSGEHTQSTLDLITEALPSYIEKMDVIKINRQVNSPGFNFAFLEHKPVYDMDGYVRWYMTEKTSQVFARLSNGHYLFNYDIQGEQTPLIMEQDLLGKIYAVYNVSDGLHHDIVELPNGNFLATSENLNADTLEDIIVEIDRQTGHIVRYIDLQDYLSRFRPIEIGMPAEDWFHLNSIVFDPADSSIIISGRTQSAVFKFSYPSMQLRWILGVHDYWSADFQPYLLKPEGGEDFAWQWSQHHATLYQNHGSDDQFVDILLFDNGLFRSFDSEEALPAAQSYSRIVHYRINESAKTIEQVWDYGKERGSELFSVSRGSAYVMDNGNILGTWSELVKDPSGQASLVMDEDKTTETRLVEVEPSTGRVAFESSFPGVAVYRVMRSGFYDGCSQENRWIQTPVRDFTSSDLYDRFQLFAIEVKVWLRYQIGVQKQILHTWID